MGPGFERGTCSRGSKQAQSDIGGSLAYKVEAADNFNICVVSGTTNNDFTFASARTCLCEQPKRFSS